MRKPALSAWAQFEIMVQAGMPHAMDIASELVRHELRIPLPTSEPKQPVDLHFYGVIHCAYRSEVLPQFLSVTEQLKLTTHWITVQESQRIQMRIVQICETYRGFPLIEIRRIVLSHLSELREVA